MIRIDDPTLAKSRLDAETRVIDAATYGKGVIQQMIAEGHIVLVSEETRTDGRGEIAILLFDDPKKPTELYAKQIWGPSKYDDGRDRHLDILVRVCQWGVDNGYGDLPISYGRDGHVLTQIADAILLPARAGELSRDGQYTHTTLRRALVALTAAKPAGTRV